MSSARRARRSCCRAACTRRPGPSTSAIPNLKIEVAKIGRSRAAARRAGRSGSRPPPTTRAFDGFIFRNLTGETCDATSIPARRAVLRRRRRPEPGDLFAARRDLPRRRVPGQLDVAPLGAARSGVDGPVRHRARHLHRRHQCAAHSAAAARRRRVLARRATGSRASACCTPSRRTTSRRRRDADRRLRPAQGRAQLHHAAASRPISAARELTLGVVGNNLLNDDIRNHVSFKKDEVLMPGRSVRFFATLKN